MIFDNHDTRIKYYQLLLERFDLENLPVYELPAGYRFVYYWPGDRDHWVEIEQSAKEFDTYEQGKKEWEVYFGGQDALLTSRMVFIETETGEKVATASAWYDVTGRDTSGACWLHWVAVKRNHQGKGLSKPLIAHVLGIMKQLGFSHVKIPTQTCTWVACKIYLDFGFRPIPKNAVNSREGWRIARALTNHPALAEFDAASLEEILTESAIYT